jgi:hypothetical protein
MKTLTSRQMIGGGLVILGASIFFSNLFEAAWLIASTVALLAVITVWHGINGGSPTEFLLGLALLITAYMIGLFWALDTSTVQLLGMAFFGAGILLLSGLAGSQLVKSIHIPWLSIPAGLFTGLGATFLFTSLSLLDFILSIGLSLGIGLILWSFISKYYGLMLAGAIVSSHSVSVAVS